MNVIAREEFEFANYDVAVQYVNHCMKCMLSVAFNDNAINKTTRRWSRTNNVCVNCSCICVVLGVDVPLN